jgi:cell division protein FtsX
MNKTLTIALIVVLHFSAFLNGLLYIQTQNEQQAGNSLTQQVNSLTQQTNNEVAAY